MEPCNKTIGESIDDGINWIEEAREDTEQWRRLVHNEAKKLVALGYYVLPVRRLEKKAPVLGFSPSSASRKPSTIDKWFDPKRGEYAGWNLGIAVGKRDDYGLVVVADSFG
jgi:hypothetical protein